MTARSTAQTAVAQAKAEVALAVRLQALLRTPGAAWFFEPHPEQGWADIDALEAWESWVQAQLSVDEMALYRDRYEHEFGAVAELRQALAVDSNRIPDSWNVDGY